MIPHNKPTLGFAEQAAAARVLGTGWVAQGAEVEAFEQELCKFFGLPDGHAAVVSSGSSALYLALWALNGHDARVGMPVYLVQRCAMQRASWALRVFISIALWEGLTSIWIKCLARISTS
jgi:dTDP-4-amino-4,6-dideoxygalactose transaminase